MVLETIVDVYIHTLVRVQSSLLSTIMAVILRSKNHCFWLVCILHLFLLGRGSSCLEHSKSKESPDLDLHDNGGWSTPKEDILAFPGPCNIERRTADSLSQEEFLNRYAYNLPVIIREATDNSVFQEQCTKDTMLREHASKRIRLSSANTHSYQKVDVTLQEYVEKYLKPQTLKLLGNETFYWFGDNNFTEWKSLIDLYNPPPYFLPKMTGAYSFGLAGAGTGVPFHFHGPGFGEVVFGRKRWFLYPPEKTPRFHPNRTTLQWLHEEYPEIHPLEMPLECTMSKGEIIYFPDRWWHGTLNIDTSVFISTFLG